MGGPGAGGTGRLRAKHVDAEHDGEAAHVLAEAEVLLHTLLSLRLELTRHQHAGEESEAAAVANTGHKEA